MSTSRADPAREPPAESPTTREQPRIPEIPTSPCPLAVTLARRLREASRDLTARWLERIVQRVSIDPNRVFPLAIGVLQVLALDIGTDLLPARPWERSRPGPFRCATAPVPGSSWIGGCWAARSVSSGRPKSWPP